MWKRYRQKAEEHQNNTEEEWEEVVQTYRENKRKREKRRENKRKREERREKV